MSKLVVLDRLPEEDRDKSWVLTGLNEEGTRCAFCAFHTREECMYYMLVSRMLKGKPVAWWFPQHKKDLTLA